MSIYLKAGGTTLSTAYTIEKAKQPFQIINRGLDGTTYVQNIGSPTTTYKIRAILDDETARNNADTAWEDGTECRATIGLNTVNIGVITGITYQGPLPGGKYLADITTAV